MRYLPALLIAALPVAGCQEKQPMTVSDFMNNEAALYGTLVRCEQDPSAGTDLECSNARQAAERLLVIEERALRKAREEAFASAREEYRARLERERELRLKAEAEAEEARLQALLSRQQDELEEIEEVDVPGEIDVISETAAPAAEPPPGE
jgi:hypothetical protein